MSVEESDCSGSWKTKQRKKLTEKKEGTNNPPTKEPLNNNVDISQWGEGRGSVEKYIRCSIKSHIETVTKKMKGSSSE